MFDVHLPLGIWVEQGVHYLLNHYGAAFSRVGAIVDAVSGLIEALLTGMTIWGLGAVFFALAIWRLGWLFAGFTLLSFFVIIGSGFGPHMTITLGLILTSTLISLLLGIPLGILASRHLAVSRMVRPMLDFMQTMPAFVYLIPAAMLFGLGRPPGIMATVIFAMPPAVRLTELGLRQVAREQVEAGLAFGCSRWQLLTKVQLPHALPSIMTGVNQTVMMAMSMVIIASMVGAGGLGNDIMTSIQQLDIGLGFESGLAVVLLAILLDRLSSSLVRTRPAQR